MGESAIDILVPVIAELLVPGLEPGQPTGAQPHVSVLYPWRPSPVSDQDLADLRAAVAGAEPFLLELTRVATFESGVVYLACEPDGAVRGLMRRLASAFPDAPPYGGRFPDPVPHLTVGVVESVEDLAAAAGAAATFLAHRLPITTPVNSVVVQEEVEGGTWRVRARVGFERT